MWQAGNSLAASPLANSLAGFAREGNWRLRRRSPAQASRQLSRLHLTLITLFLHRPLKKSLFLLVLLKYEACTHFD